MDGNSHRPPPAKKTRSFLSRSDSMPLPRTPGTLLTPHKLALRLRTRLMQARALIERDLGRSLTSIVPQDIDNTDEQSRLSGAAEYSSSWPTAVFDRKPFQQRRGARPRPMTMRAHSYSQGDYPALNGTDERIQRARDNNGDAATPRNQVTRRRARAAAWRPPRDASPTPPLASMLLRTPEMRPQGAEGGSNSNDNEAAQMMLMLSTPPAARARLGSMSPLQQRALRSNGSRARSGRRLSFSQCAAERPGKRMRTAAAEDSIDTSLLDSPNIASSPEPPVFKSQESPPTAL
ncbi:hypothetical protein GGI07_005258 [Coemansia sp. Benny D115]|nr:hypothetical protein GGI07_005258 [Coemansia sp. Benny D115]